MKKRIEVALPLEASTPPPRGKNPSDTDIPHAAPVVDAATVSGGPGGDFLADGG